MKVALTTTRNTNACCAPDHLRKCWARVAGRSERREQDERRAGAAELDVRYGATPRQIVDIFYSGSGKGCARRRVHPRRILARASAFGLQRSGSGLERARRHGRPARLRSRAAGGHRRHCRADALGGAPVPAQAVRQAHARARPLGGRTSCGCRRFMWGLLSCGKGDPMQLMAVGHGCAPARFRGIKVGSE